jgi:N-acetylmuramic acid 6-phosphate etherase
VAGGTRALRRSVEGAEDDERAGARELRRRRLGRKDWVIGVSASGRTPFVIGALAYARSAGTGSTLITCNPKRGALYLPTGPEVVSGSTRLKAGTATKLVLNMLTTAAMVRLQRVFAGYMVDLRMNNRKLRRRAVRIVRKLAGVGAARARRAILQARGNPKTAVAMLAGGLDYRRARAKLRRSSLQDLVRR